MDTIVFYLCLCSIGRSTQKSNLWYHRNQRSRNWWMGGSKLLQLFLLWEYCKKTDVQLLLSGMRDLAVICFLDISVTCTVILCTQFAGRSLLAQRHHKRYWKSLRDWRGKRMKDVCSNKLIQKWGFSVFITVSKIGWQTFHNCWLWTWHAVHVGDCQWCSVPLSSRYFWYHIWWQLVLCPGNSVGS